MTLDLTQWIAGCEGLRLRPYTDSYGYLTIGYGHNLSENGITIAIAQALLNSDIVAAQKQVFTNCPWIADIGIARSDALVHLCFWVGIGAFMGFKDMLAAAEAENWQAAHDTLINSTLHAEIPDRCEAIANRLLTGNMS